MLYDLFAIIIVAEFNLNKEEVVCLNNANGSETYKNFSCMLLQNVFKCNEPVFLMNEICLKS